MTRGACKCCDAWAAGGREPAPPQLPPFAVPTASFGGFPLNSGTAPFRMVDLVTGLLPVETPAPPALALSGAGAPRCRDVAGWRSLPRNV